VSLSLCGKNSAFKKETKVEFKGLKYQKTLLILWKDGIITNAELLKI